MTKLTKGDHPGDPRGLIFESYRIEGITEGECRSIFLDWALGVDQAQIKTHLESLLAHYQSDHGDHPMTKVMLLGLNAAAAPKRRGGAAGRRR